MLRSLTLQESLLTKLCQSKNWNQVRIRAQSHPEEAKPSHAANRGLGTTPLSIAVRGGAPLSTIDILLKANVDALVKVRHARHGTVLHEAIKHGANVQVVLLLVETIVRYEKKYRWMSRGELKPISFEFAGEGVEGGKSKKVAAETSTPSLSGKNHHQVVPVMDDATNSSSSRSLSLLGVQKTSDESSPAHKYNSNTIFNITGDLGQTPLHYAVDRVCRSVHMGYKIAELTTVVQTLIEAYPPAAGKKDTDGCTPLDLALMTLTTRVDDMEVEMKLLEPIRFMIKCYPMSACPSVHSARVNKQYQLDGFHKTSITDDQMSTSNPTDILRNGSVLVLDRRQALQNVVDGNISHNPLSKALLYGRHFTTIQLILEASGSLSSSSSSVSWHTGHLHDNDTSGNSANPSCMSIVSSEYEVPLHIATTMGASPDIVSLVLEAAEDASVIPDRNGLTPICWSWFRFVVDRNILLEATDGTRRLRQQQRLIRASQRRLLPNNFQIMYDATTEALADSIQQYDGLKIKRNFTSSHEDGKGKLVKNHNHLVIDDEMTIDVGKKLSALLPCAAKILATHSTNNALWKRIDASSKENKTMEWSIIHAACFISCPRGIVILASKMSKDNIYKQDFHGNLPLHYAAARSLYQRENILVGHHMEPTTLMDKSIVMDILSQFPKGARVSNCNRQLPLHLAIEEENKSSLSNRVARRRARKSVRRDSRSLSQIYLDIKSSPVMHLLDAYPEALDRRDGVTGLFPFMQAAIGVGSDLNLIYLLMKENPTVVNAGI